LQFFLHELPVLAELLQDVSQTAGLSGQTRNPYERLIGASGIEPAAARLRADPPPDGARGGRTSNSFRGPPAIIIHSINGPFQEQRQAALVAGLN